MTSHFSVEEYGFHEEDKFKYFWMSFVNNPYKKNEIVFKLDSKSNGILIKKLISFFSELNTESTEEYHMYFDVEDDYICITSFDKTETNVFKCPCINREDRINIIKFLKRNQS